MSGENPCATAKFRCVPRPLPRSRGKRDYGFPISPSDSDFGSSIDPVREERALVSAHRWCIGEATVALCGTHINARVCFVSGGTMKLPETRLPPCRHFSRFARRFTRSIASHGGGGGGGLKWINARSRTSLKLANASGRQSHEGYPEFFSPPATPWHSPFSRQRPALSQPVANGERSSARAREPLVVLFYRHRREPVPDVTVERSPDKEERGDTLPLRTSL